MTSSSHLCPLCGQSNSCAQQGQAQAVSQCWCFTVQIDPNQLQKLRPEQLNQACLCPRCSQALAEPKDAS